MLLRVALKDFAPDPSALEGAVIPQAATTKPMRRGTKKLLEAGLKKVEAYVEHGVKPQFAHRTLRAETHREAFALAHVGQKPSTVKGSFLVERCCRPDSELTKQWAAEGGRGLSCLAGARGEAGQDHGPRCPED